MTNIPEGFEIQRHDPKDDIETDAEFKICDNCESQSTSVDENGLCDFCRE